jgi:large subunit ribosomal protein L10
LAKTKSEKETMLNQYVDWISKSQALILIDYTGLKMSNLDTIRAKARETGGSFHILKNTLAKLALEKAGYTVPADFMAKSTAVGFAFSDPAGLAKGLTEATKGLESVKIKGGYMGKEMLNAAQVKALASLPALPVMRATLLGVLLAPASKLVRTLAEPGRSLAYVVNAHANAGTPAAA